jgi:hypothetical protein
MAKANGMKSLALSVCMKMEERHECLDEDFFREEDENFANKSVLGKKGRKLG